MLLWIAAAWLAACVVLMVLLSALFRGGSCADEPRRPTHIG